MNFEVTSPPTIARLDLIVQHPLFNLTTKRGLNHNICFRILFLEERKSEREGRRAGNSARADYQVSDLDSAQVFEIALKTGNPAQHSLGIRQYQSGLSLCHVAYFAATDQTALRRDPCSSFLIWIEIDGCVMPSTAAALEKFFCSVTNKKTFS